MNTNRRNFLKGMAIAPVAAGVAVSSSVVTEAAVPVETKAAVPKPVKGDVYVRLHEGKPYIALPAWVLSVAVDYNVTPSYSFGSRGPVGMRGGMIECTMEMSIDDPNHPHLREILRGDMVHRLRFPHYGRTYTMENVQIANLDLLTSSEHMTISMIAVSVDTKEWGP